MISLSGSVLLVAFLAMMVATAGCHHPLTEYERLSEMATTQARPRQITGKWFSKGSSHGPYEAGTDTILEIKPDGTGALRYQRRPLPANHEAEYDLYPFLWTYRGNGFWFFDQKSTSAASYVKGTFRFSQGYLLRETRVGTSATESTILSREIFVPANKLPSRPRPENPSPQSL